MAKTLTDTEVKKTTATPGNSAPARDRAEQPRKTGQRAWIIAPLVLALVSSMALLVARRLFSKGTAREQ